MWTSRVFATVVALVLTSSVGQADGSRDAFLVSSDWLAQHQGDPDLVLLHVGDKNVYEAGHIPGARFVTTRDLSAPAEATNGLTLEMPSPDTLRSQLTALGISDNSHIVVYYGQDPVSPATRVVFTLLYAGLQNVSLLDGGMGAWTKSGHQVTAAVPPARTGTLGPLKTKPLVVDAEFVRSHLTTPGFTLVDARSTAFYDGSQEGGPADHRLAGHIAGAGSLPFTALTAPDLSVQSSEALAAAFQNAGIARGATVIAYCHIGQQATATLFGALLLGHPVLLYDGSFEDWARRGLPVDNPAKKDR